MYMWNRKELKQNARQVLKKYFWPTSFLAGMIVWFFACSGTAVKSNTALTAREIFSTYGLLLTVLAVVFMLVDYLVLEPFLLGVKRFYMKPEEGLHPFYYFTDGRLMKVAKIIFLRNLRVFLFCLLLVVPGIIKMFELDYVDYLLIENENLSFNEYAAESKRLTDGRKMDIFVLGLSFILWNMIEFIPLVGAYIASYKEHTFVEAYRFAKENVKA